MRVTMFLRSFLLLLVVLAAPCRAWAGTWFAATCGNDAWAGVSNICSAPLGPKRSIQAAIDQAVNGDTVIVMPGVYVGLIDLDGKAITLISAAGAGSTFIDGGGNGPVVTCNSLEGPGTVIEGFTIQNGHAAGNGGGMFMALASPTINDCLFTNNTGDWGGGLYAITSSPALNGCTFTDNTASVHGGGAAFKFGQPALTECEFSFNAALLWGGGLLLDDTAEATITGGVFTGNASAVGAGLLAKNGAASISSVIFSINVASVHGGGLEFQFMDSAEVDNCAFASNSVTAAGGAEGGGAMWIAASAATISNCDFNTNTAPFGGGAVYCDSADGTAFTGCTFTQNENLGCCGASAVQSMNSTLSFLGCSFTGNEVSQYGGAIMAEASDLTLTFCGFHDNLAPDWIAYGAAIFLNDSSLQAGLCTFSGNVAGGGIAGSGGGAIAGWNTSASFEGCAFQGNSTPGAGDGGAVRLAQGGSLEAFSCTFTNNTAGSGGGVWLDNLATATFGSCTFDGNIAMSGNGGGIRAVDTPILVGGVGSAFNANQSSGIGGGISFEGATDHLTLSLSQFTANTASTAGGAVSTDAETIITACGFFGNSSHDAGALAVVGPFGDAEIHSCRFDGNQAVQAGGALMVGAFSSGSAVLMVNSIVSNNTSGFGLGAIYESALGGFTHLVNCAVVDNSGGGIAIANGASKSMVDNSILWGNTAGDDLDGILPQVRFSNIEDGGMGVAPMSADPMFVNAATGNYHLSPGSPCIDAGKNWIVPQDVRDLDVDADTSELVPVDFDGQPRFADDLGAFGSGCGGLAVVDIGPYEAAGEPVEAMHPGDVNGDGVVNVTDLLALLAAWGACPDGCCAEDFNLDGWVNVTDLLMQLSNWG